jgi:hypothetical protein
MSAKPVNIAGALIAVVEDVTKDWAKQRKAEERDHNARLHRYDRLVRYRRITVRDAAFQVMEAAYRKASDNGQLPTRPRQIMYAARPEILKLTGGRTLDDRYFTQTLLPDFMAERPRRCRNWDIVWDARGHFTEPHTGHEIALGTLEVRGYLGLRAKRTDVVTVDPGTLFPTHGPEHRFKAVLFIEKEGFGPLFADVQLAERFDLAIMSTKGMSVTAARMLLDQLCDRDVEQIFVLHDFDVSGFSIFGTLGVSGRRYEFINDVPVIDIGLRFDDVEEMGLESEPVDVSGNWDRRAETLRRHGATEEEIEFLEDKRVELNAMTSRQLVDFVEAKLKEHGVVKLIPEDEIIEEHARRLLEQRFAEEAIAPLRAKIAEQAKDAALPDDLLQSIADKVDEKPYLPWDVALAYVLNGDTEDDPDDAS